MLDTFASTLPEESFVIEDMAQFGRAHPIEKGGHLWYLNPSAAEKRAGVQKPALTLTERLHQGGVRRTLRIEGSLPNIHLGNNVEELAVTDLPAALEHLSCILAESGIWVPPEAIADAPLSKIHYARNLLLPPGTPASAILRELQRSPRNGHRDRRDRAFANGGEAFYDHTDLAETIAYEKIADILKAQRTPKRAIDPASWPGAAPLLAALPANAQVFRLERRLNSPRAIREHTKRAGTPLEHPTLRTAYNEDIANAVLMKALASCTPPPRKAGTMSALTLLGQLLAASCSPSLAFKRLGYALAEQEGGAAAVQTLLREQGVPQHFWYQSHHIRELPPGCGCDDDPLGYLRAALLDYRPLRLGDMGIYENDRERQV